MKKVQSEGKKTKKDLTEQMKSSSFWTEAIRTLALIAFYYLASIGLTFYQSWLLKRLQFPLTIVLCHFVMKFIASGLCRYAYSAYTGIERVTLGWSHIFGRIGVVAVVASLDIGLSQWSFEYIDVALYTITKSTSIVFILMFAILFRLEKKHWSLIVIVLMISSGLAMFTYKSTDFVLIGFLMVLSASFLSGIRWTLSQLIMQKSKLGLANPVDMIYHLQPVMILCLLPFAIGFEGARIATSVSVFRFEDPVVFLQTVALVSIGGVIAFVMELTEFLLVSYTSGLTLSVAGIVKEIISLTLAVIYQSTDISPINLVGLVVCMVGITLHVIRKASTAGRGGAGEQGGPRLRREGGKVGTSLPLLSDTDSGSETELFHATPVRGAAGRNSRAKPITEEIFMRDHRQWTTVRDTHIEMYKDKTSPGSKQAEVMFSNSGQDRDVVTEELIEVYKEDEDVSTDAILEAEKLLDQLDMMSSD